MMNKLVLISLFALILVISQSEAWTARGKKKDVNDDKRAMRGQLPKIRKLDAKDDAKDYDDEDIEEIDDETNDESNDESNGESSDESNDEWKYAVKTIAEEVEKLLE